MLRRRSGSSANVASFARTAPRARWSGPPVIPALSCSATSESSARHTTWTGVASACPPICKRELSVPPMSIAKGWRLPSWPARVRRLSPRRALNARTPRPRLPSASSPPMSSTRTSGSPRSTSSSPMCSWATVRSSGRPRFAGVVAGSLLAGPSSTRTRAADRRVSSSERPNRDQSPTPSSSCSMRTCIGGAGMSSDSTRNPDASEPRHAAEDDGLRQIAVREPHQPLGCCAAVQAPLQGGERPGDEQHRQQQEPPQAAAARACCKRWCGRGGGRVHAQKAIATEKWNRHSPPRPSSRRLP